MSAEGMSWGAEIPEDRVRAFLDAHREYGGDGDLYDMVDGDQIITLTASDVRDVLNELDAARDQIIDLTFGDLRDVLAELDAARARIAELERAPQWKVGDPDPTPGRPNGDYCHAVSPDDDLGLHWQCTWAPGHTEAQHVAGDGETIRAVWDVDVPTDPAPQGDPITSTTD
jgi:hypothetical protein